MINKRAIYIVSILLMLSSTITISFAQNEQPGKDDAVTQLKGLTPTQSYLRINDFILNATSLKEFKFCLSENLRKDSLGNSNALGIFKMVAYPKVKIISEKVTGNVATLKGKPLAPASIGLPKTLSFIGIAVKNPSKADRERLANEEKESLKRRTGTIVLRREGGVWKLHTQSWKTELPKLRK